MNLQTYIIRFLVPLLFTGSYCYSQLPDYQLSRLQEQDGLKTSDLLCISRDQQGNLWLASQSQVQRFDGKHTISYPFVESITSMLIDNKNRKWVTTRQGIYLLSDDGRKFELQKIPEKESSQMLSLYCLEKKGVFAFDEAHHYRFDENKRSFVDGEPITGITNRKLYQFIDQYGHDLVYILRNTVLFVDEQTLHADSIPLKNVFAVYPLFDGRYLACTRQFETFIVEKGKLPVKVQEAAWRLPKKNGLVCFGSVQLNDSICFVSSNYGLLQYNAATQKLSAPQFYYNGIPLANQPTVNYFHKDREGMIYMSHADGVYFMDQQSNFFKYLRNYTYANTAMQGNDIRNFSEDEEGNIWMAGAQGISRLNLTSGELTLIKDAYTGGEIAFPSYRQLLNDGDRLWIGTSGNGVWVYNKRSKRYERPWFAKTDEGKKENEEFNTTYTWELTRLSNGKVLLVGGSRSFLIDPSTLEAKKIYFSSSAYGSRAALQDSAGRIWHGTVRGLTCLDTTFKTLFGVIDSFPDKRVASFCEWKRDRMIIGSKGLFEIVMKGNNIESFKSLAGVPKERLVYCMQKDKLGFIWLGTDEGLFRYDPWKDESLSFEGVDHIQTQHFNSDAAFMTSNNWIFMGGKNGVNYFLPENFKPQRSSLKPTVSFFAANGNDSLAYQSNNIPPITYSNRDIDFIISAPEFKKPYQLRYRYRFNEEGPWIYTGFNNRIRISSLSPGDYHLQVAASFDNAHWFDSASSIDFRILKPWWQTTWFRLLCVAAAALISWSVIAYRKKRREEYQLQQSLEYFKKIDSSNQSLDLMLWDIARNCIAGLGLEDCVIYLLDDHKKVLVQKAAYGDKSPKAFEIVNPLEIPLGEGITGEVAKSGKPLIIGNTEKDARYIVDDKRRYSEITVPIVYDGKVIGVIDSEHTRKNFFSQYHLRALETIATMCSGKIASAMAKENAVRAAQELDHLNSRMMESKFLNLRLQMNPHFLFNILTSIQYLIVSGQVSKATSYLNTFSGFLRSLLNFAEETVVTLDEELRILGMYVELESLCVAETFIWEVCIEESLDKEDILVPFMLLQPFVENAINHGLINKIGEKKFTIHISEKDDDRLLCVIEDNGIGREAAADIKRKNLSEVLHKSRGIAIVEERLSLLQEKTGKKAGFTIEDLYDGSDARGTRVSIFIPYYSN